MGANWFGLFQDFPIAANVTKSLLASLTKSGDPKKANQLYSAFAAGAGILGRGNSRRFPPYLPDWLSMDEWSIKNPDDVNGGTNHFGSPFNFPEDFPSVYRLHALVPDMLEYRDFADQCDASKIITDAQLDRNHQPINDCLGHPDGSVVTISKMSIWSSPSTPR
jgi:hypothetical protein